MNPTKDTKVKERFEAPRVTNLEGREIHLDEADLETISGGVAGTSTSTSHTAARIDVDGHLCLGGG